VLTVLLDDGSVARAAGGSWQTLLHKGQLSGSPTLTGLTWADSSVGWVTGSRPGAGPTAFQTVDGGAHWTAVDAANGVAASAPCGAGRSWVMPVLGGDGKLVVLRTSDDGATWLPGASVSTGTADPVWGCNAQHVWIAASVGHTERVLASHDAGQTWSDEGDAPAGLDALAPTGDGGGFAVSRTGKGAVLWTVTDDGTTFRQRSLPGWVASLGADQATS
jgi:hypothetical protein